MKKRAVLFKNKIIGLINKENIIAVAIFLLSRVRIYGDISPMGFSALLGAGKVSNPLHIFSFVLGSLLSGAGFTAFLRHNLTLLTVFILKRIIKLKLKRPILCMISVLTGAFLSLLIRGFSYYDVVLGLFESLISSVLVLIYFYAKEILKDEEKRRNTNEAEFSVVFFAIVSLVLSFSDIEVWRISLFSVSMIFIAMGCSYKNSYIRSSFCGMIIGFFYFVFSPLSSLAVCYFALCGAIGSFLKNYGKIFIPLTYILVLPVFYHKGTNFSAINIYEVLFSGLVFTLIPASCFEIIKVVTPQAYEEKKYLKIKDSLMALEDTFSSISEAIRYPSFVLGKDGKEDAAKEAVKEVCSRCGLYFNCGINAVSRLSEKNKIKDKEKRCIKQDELKSAFLKNYEIVRQERMWQKRMAEETEAIAERMKCISGVFGTLSREKDSLIKEDEIAQREILYALRKEGIHIKRLKAGWDSHGCFEASIELIPCKEGSICDSVIPETIKNVIGISVERVGVKNCSRCFILYRQESPYKVVSYKLSLPFEEKCGDSVAFARINRENFAIALSDGMGTGIAASKDSNFVAHIVLKLLSGGMNMEQSIKMINSLLVNRSGGKSFATLDMALINLYTLRCQFIKNGAVSGYILQSSGKVKRLEGKGSPLGAIGSMTVEINEINLKDGDTLIMVSDGVTDSFGENGEEKIEKLLSGYTLGTPEDLASFIAENACKISGKRIKDDMTVIVSGCIKRRRNGNNMGKKEA